MPCDGDRLGGTMRLGRHSVWLDGRCHMAEAYALPDGGRIHERHRHRYEVNSKYVAQMAERGLRFTGRSECGEDRIECVELGAEQHPFYVGVQFHPEYQSTIFRPAPPYAGFLNAAAAADK